MNAESFFARWQTPAKDADTVSGAVAPSEELREPEVASPLPTEADVADLAPGASVANFMRVGVDEQVKRDALKKLFADPHYNVMDGLDTYIADYGLPDPIPDAMLQGLNQLKTIIGFGVEAAAQREREAAAIESKRGIDADLTPPSQPSPIQGEGVNPLLGGGAVTPSPLTGDGQDGGEMLDRGTGLGEEFATPASRSSSGSGVLAEARPAREGAGTPTE